MGSDERELLLAPIGGKGDESGSTYKWVANQRKNEMREELNRLLYVACTRARKELHLLSSLELDKAKIKKPDADSLLKIGWPYFEEILNQQLAVMRGGGGPFLVPSKPMDAGTLSRIAAESAPHLLSSRRLPADWRPHTESNEDGLLNSGIEAQNFSQQSPGITAQGLIARAVGVATHALLQQMSLLPEGDVRRDLTEPATLLVWRSIAAARLRQEGLAGKELSGSAVKVLALLQATVSDPIGRWILDHKSEAHSESAWTMVVDGVEQNVRADRVFMAGDEPLKNGDTHLWIVDYKTTGIVDYKTTGIVDYKTTGIADSKTTILELSVGIPLDERARYEPQLALYGRVLRSVLGLELPLRLALYYPAIPHLDWWAG
jgi:ATP-dependent exoDNAse (exonuclease V) beta subunit